MRSVAAHALALLLSCAAAAAQSLPDYAKDSLGEWLAVPDDGRPGCRIRLTAERTIGGWSAIPAANCAERLPKLAAASAWDYEQGVRLRDPARKLLVAFEEDETTLLKTRAASGPATMLVRAKAGVERAPFAPDLFGTWVLRRPGGPTLCEVTLLKAPPPGGEESFALRLGSPCDAAVTRLRLVSWRIEDFALMLYGSADASLRFEPGPDGYEKAEGGKPLHLVRAR